MTGRRPLLLLGAGGFARETAELVRALDVAGVPWDLVGMLDDDPALHGTLVGGVPVLGPLAAVHDHPDTAVVAALASPRHPARRLDVVGRLGVDDDRWATLVHPAAVVPPSARLGAGTVVHAATVITCGDVAVGRHVAVMPACVLTHDDVVEDGVTFGAGVRLAGGVTVREGAYLGSGCLVREHLEIGVGALVGMGAVVTHDVPAGEVWHGVPARPLAVTAAGGAR